MTQVIAHRGASKVELENTTMAFARALKIGANAVELDVRQCQTGELIVHHDAKLADGQEIIRLTKSELPPYIPTLAEALDACGAMWVNIEIKNDPTEPDFDPSDQVTHKVVSYLSQRGSIDKWLISSFRRQSVDLVRTLSPAIKTAWLVVTIKPDDLESVAKSMAGQGHFALHPHHKNLSKHLIDIFHANNLQVNTWTCDDPLRISELVDWGIDGICTNLPDLALEVIERRKKVLTTATEPRPQEA